MKKVIVFIAVIMLIIAASAVFADGSGTGTGFYTEATFAQPTTGYQVLSLTLGDWIVNYTGAVTVSTTNADASLFGNFDGYIWKYEYSADNGAHWNEIGKLVANVTVLAGTKSDESESNATSLTIYANKLKISFDATLVSPGSNKSNASGSGTITANAAIPKEDIENPNPVPEPGSFLALGTGIVGLVGFVIRKRRA